MHLARDTRLGRLAAIKTLPTEVAADPSRVQRFEQEARAASSLNHPNIVHIYDVGTHEGVHFIAMEYVEGQTLREILESGALVPERLLSYARQLAEGLAKAHAAKVVHRDLKPENVMVTTDGYVKILDFGLAKLYAEVVDGQTEAPTLERAGTTPGTVLGTAGYMSPEQARGLTADYRADQFSFGAILYEMAAGRRAFSGDTALDRLSAILRDHPPPVTGAGDAVQSVLTRCLKKAPEDATPRRPTSWMRFVGLPRPRLQARARTIPRSRFCRLRT